MCVVQDPEPISVGGQLEHKINKILQQKGSKCLVRWKKTRDATWEEIGNLQEDVPELVRQFQRQNHAGHKAGKHIK
jgi:hypothetical protein